MKKLILFAAIFAAAVACEKPAPENNDTQKPGTETPAPKPEEKPEPKPEDKVSIDHVSHIFKAAEALTFEVTVTSSADWTLEVPADSWVTPSATSGKSGDKVTFTATENPTAEKRGPVKFTFKVGKATAEFSAEQEAKEIEFALADPSQQHLQISSASQDIKVFFISKYAELTKEKVSGSFPANYRVNFLTEGGKPGVKFMIDQNTKGAERVAEWKIMPKGEDGKPIESLAIVIKITQAA